MAILKNLGALLVGIVFSLVLAEVGLRLFWHPDFLNKNFHRDDLSWIQKNVKLNAYGYRDQEFLFKKDESKLRVYSLGDSFTYGWYIDSQELAYPNEAEKVLSSKGIPVEIINASQPGFKPNDSLERFKNEGLVMAPDVVTLGVNIYDLTRNEFAPRYNKLLKESLVYQLTFGNLERARVAAKTEAELQASIASDSENLERFAQTVKEFKKLTSIMGARFVLVIFPNYDPANPNALYGYELFHRQIQKIATQEKIDLIDLFSSYSEVEDKKQLVLNPTDDHPSILANKIAAQKLAEYLEREIGSGRNLHVYQNIRKQMFKIGDSLPDRSFVVSLGSLTDKWVYFDLSNDLGVQKAVLRDKKFRRFDYLVDYLKVAKSTTHEGWPGAKIEYNTNGGKLIKIPLDLYGFRVLGASQLTGYWREGGNQNSRDIEYSSIIVTRDKNDLIINVESGDRFDLYRVNLDVAVTQVNIDGEKLNSLAKTKVFSGVAEGEDKIFFAVSKPLSLAKYTSSLNSKNYFWSNNVMVFGGVKKEESGVSVDLKGQAQGSLVEVVVMQEADPRDQKFAVETVNY